MAHVTFMEVNGGGGGGRGEESTGRIGSEEEDNTSIRFERWGNVEDRGPQDACRSREAGCRQESLHPDESYQFP